MGSQSASSKSTNNAILTAFNQQVELTPNKLAVVEGENALTYRDLQMKSKELSQQLNLDNNPIVAILLPGGVDHILSIFAVLNSSRAFTLLSVDFPAVKLQAMLESIGNPLLITRISVFKPIDLTYKNIHFLDVIKQITVGRNENTFVKPLAEDNAAVYFTSGSTGVPKACLVGNSALVRNAKCRAERMKITLDDEYVFVSNPAFVVCMHDILISLLSGATIHVPPNHLRYDTSKLREWVKAKGTITVMSMVCSVGEAFFTAEPQEFPKSLRLLMVAGEKLQKGPPETTPFQVCNMYGSTETLTISSTIVGPVSLLKDPVTNTLVGQAFQDVDIYILDEDTLKPLKVGETGEIAIGGPRVSAGYLNSPTATNQKFIQIGIGARVFRTGDLGYIMPDGNLVVLNRSDNQVKVSGNRFDLSDLESALLQHSCIEKAVAILEKSKEQRFHLFYSHKPSISNDPVPENEINEFLKHRLPHYAFPHSTTCIDQFPRNANGKLDKAALLQMIAKDKVVEPPSTDTEILLTKIWSEILGVPFSKISRNDNLFSLGGSSLTASKVINRLKESNFNIKVFNIFKIPVLKDLAQYLERGSDLSIEGVKDFEAELNSINLELSSLNQLGLFNHTNSSNAIFFTGATGYLGSYLVLELLAQTQADIYCLIRASSPEEAQFRLEVRLKSLKMRPGDKNLGRLHFVAGDLSKPYLGLSEAEYYELAESIDQVYHCAAEVHWLKRYEELRAANVIGTAEILKFVSTKRLIFLHYISTVGVLEQSSPDVQLENRDLSKNIQLECGYSQSKWVAEKLVWKGVDAGIPAIIYRPGIIGSDSTGNIVNDHDFITILLKACRIMDAYPDFPWRFPYGTLDFTAKSIAAIFQNSETNCLKVFHIFQNSISFESFNEYFENEGLRKVSISDWKDMIFSVESGSEKFDSLEMIKFFLTVPFHEDLTIFQKSERKMNISNRGTREYLNSFETKPKLLNESDQLKSLGDSIFRENQHLG